MDTVPLLGRKRSYIPLFRCLLTFVFAALRLFVHFCWNDLNSAACCFDLGSSTGRKLMRAYSQRTIHFALTQDLHQAPALSLCHQARPHQGIRRHLRTRFKEFQIIDIDNTIIMADSLVTFAQAAREGKWLPRACRAAAKSPVYCSASASLLAFCTPASGLATTGAVSTPNPPFPLV